MTLIKVFSCAFCLLYLLYQSFFDAKTGLVSKFVNDAAVVISIGLAISALFFTSFMPISLVFDAFVLWLLSELMLFKTRWGKAAQPADVKAMWVMYLSSFWWCEIKNSLYISICSMLTACIAVLIYKLFKTLTDRKAAEAPFRRIPLFPFMLIGNSISVALWFCVLR